MAKISKVWYTHIGKPELDGFDPNDYFFHQNMLDSHVSFQEGFEAYEKEQRRVIDRVLQDSVEEGVDRFDIDSTSMIMSPLHDVAALVTVLHR